MNDVQHALKVTFDWWLELVIVKAVWRSVTKTSGAQCVTWAGILMMVMWLVVRLDLVQVCMHIANL